SRSPCRTMHQIGFLSEDRIAFHRKFGRKSKSEPNTHRFASSQRNMASPMKPFGVFSKWKGDASRQSFYHDPAAQMNGDSSQKSKIGSVGAGSTDLAACGYISRRSAGLR